MEPVKLKRAVLKEEFLAITGDPVAAILLNQFLYWCERMKDVDKYLSEENERRKVEEKEALPLTHGWIYKSAQELAEEIMLASRATVQRALKLLIQKGYIEERENPNHSWDRTKQYRVNLLKIIQDLNQHGYTLQGYKFLENLNFPQPTNTNPKNAPNLSKIPTNQAPEQGVAQNEQCIAHYEQWNAHTEQSSAQNEQTIPNIISENTTYTHSLYSASEREKIISDIVKEFYKSINQPKITKSKLKKGIEIINQLLDEGFSIEEIAWAINWTLKNVKNTFSIAVITETISQALKEFESFKTRRLKVLKEQREVEKSTKEFIETQEKNRLILEAEKKLDEKTKQEIRNLAHQILIQKGITPDNLLYKLLLEIHIKEIIYEKFIKNKQITQQKG